MVTSLKICRFSVYICLITIMSGGCKQPTVFTLTGYILKGNSGRYVVDSMTARLYDSSGALCFTSEVLPNKFTIKAVVPSEGFYSLQLYGMKVYDTTLQKWIGGAPSVELYIQKNQHYALHVDDPSELFYQSRKIVFSSSLTQNLLSKWTQSSISVNDSMKKVKTSLVKKMNDAEANHNDKAYRLYADSISVELDSIEAAVLCERLIEFCESHPDNIISPYLLLKRGYWDDRHYAALKEAYSVLTDSIKDSRYAGELDRRLKNIKRLILGATVPEIEGVTPEGDKFDFDYSKFKLTMIDFWASWCGPCRKQLPMVKSVYDEFHSKGFGIIGVSFDNRKDPWIKAITEDSLFWYQVYNPREQSDQRNASSFAVYEIPQNYLIDSDGRIVAKDISPDTLSAYVRDYLAEH